MERTWGKMLTLLVPTRHINFKCSQTVLISTSLQSIWLVLLVLHKLDSAWFQEHDSTDENHIWYDQIRWWFSTYHNSISISKQYHNTINIYIKADKIIPANCSSISISQQIWSSLKLDYYLMMFQNSRCLRL